MNSEIHSINTGYHSDIRPLVNLTTYKNGTYYTGIKVLNNLPIHIKKFLIMLIINLEVKGAVCGLKGTYPAGVCAIKS